MERHPHMRVTDPVIASLVEREEARQFYTAKLIPSENYASTAVLEASATVLTNKYSEGYARKRYYEGQQFIDAIEELAIDRAKALFGADHANVQPYSGSPANLAAYTALIAKKSDNQRILGMGLPHGGHLTHGWKVSVTSRFFSAEQYAVDEQTHLIDFDDVRAKALAFRPAVIVCGASAYPRIIDFARFAEIAAEVGARLVADMAHIAGLVAGGAHPSPVPYADVVTSTSHKTLRGPRGGLILCKAEHARAVDRAVFPGLQGGPHNHTVAALAVALQEADTDDFKRYAHALVANAKAMAEQLLSQGVRLVSGGTDNHLILFDAASLGATGKEAAVAMDKAGLEANANSIPFDPRGPFDPSGVRIGSPALTARGLGPADMVQIANWIVAAVRAREDDTALAGICADVREMMTAYPPPGFEKPWPDPALLDTDRALLDT